MNVEKSNKEIPLLIILRCFLLPFVFGIAVCLLLQSLKARQPFIAEPDRCALCGFGYKGLCLVDTAEGSVIPIDFIKPENETACGYIDIQSGTGYSITSEPDKNHAELSVEYNRDFNPADNRYFCAGCRQKLAEANTANSFVIADTDSVTIYCISPGAEYRPNGCAVIINGGLTNGEYTVKITGEPNIPT